MMLMVKKMEPLRQDKHAMERYAAAGGCFRSRVLAVLAWLMAVRFGYVGSANTRHQGTFSAAFPRRIKVTRAEKS
jgi:hypothetical protein